MNKEFESQYKLLNREQKKAVDFTEGPVMVIAGPGTGKTHLLTMRIANILKKTDTPPEGILALTFTESGASSIRNKLSQLIGSNSYQVNISTFHGFSNDIIKEYHDYFPDIIGASNISEIEQIKIIGEIVDKLKLEKLKPFSNQHFYLKQIIRSINELKREGVSVFDFINMIAKEEKDFLLIEDLYNANKLKAKYLPIQNNILRNKDLSKVYEEYQKKLASLHYYDYNDMIMKVMIALKDNPDLLIKLQESYLYILVDEHQDTNRAQNKILEFLTNHDKSPNIFIVGDGKQAIFRFQGASKENFFYFKNLYKDTKVIILNQNYRSTQTILDAAEDVIKSDQKLASQLNNPESKIKFYSFRNSNQEEVFIATDILELIDQILPASIAILARDNKDVISISNTLAKFNIPYSIESSQDIFKDSDISKLLIIFKALHRMGSAAELYFLMHLDFMEIDPVDLYKISTSSYRKRINPYDIISSKEMMADLKVKDIEKIYTLGKNLSKWKIESHNKEASESLENIVKESGFLEYILRKEDQTLAIDKLRSIFDSVKSLARGKRNYNLSDFFSYLDIIEEHNIATKEFKGTAQGVKIMTAHKAKGLEFDYVYIIKAYDKHWGSRKNYGHIKLPLEIYFNGEVIEDNDDEERNLFYVALTRARKKIFITYAKQNEEGRMQLPAKFITEIADSLIDQKDGEETKDSFTISKSKIRINEKEKLNELFLNQGFSVTALNNYLACPWRYFYRNLVRIPEATNNNLIFGTAIHEALRMYFNNKESTKNYLLDKFSAVLATQPVPEKDYDQMLEKGIKALSGYYDYYSSSWNKDVISEFAVYDLKLGDITLTGKIDKIERTDSINVNVIDYKTGRPKSRNNILGETKNSDGNYYRQLVFYNLLLDLGGKYKMKSGTIDFIETNERGVYKREVFDISRAEVEDLKNKIIKVSKEILDLSFWNKKCDDPNCQYCKLRELV